jgi:gliding-associated putative ABC transporter substrate-binding component GldG
MKRTTKESTMINLLIFIAVIIVINLISLNIFFRLDFSKGRIYSLSPSSKVAVRQLDDRMLVKAFFTDKLPPQFATIRRYTRDLLEEYKNASGGRFRYEFINPADDTQLREEAQRSGVPPVNVQVREKDRIEVREAFLGLVFHYNGRTETIPLVQETRGLEYEITKAISKVSQIGRPRIAFYGLTPDVPADPRMRFFMMQQDKFQHAKQTIRENYDLLAVELNEPIPFDVQTLVFSGVVDSLTIEQMYYIDQFLMRGNNILFFQDRINSNLQNQMATPIESNIFDLLDHYGVNIMGNLVMDANHGMVNVQERHGIFTRNIPMAYPFLIIANEVNKNNPIVSQLSNLQFLFVSEIDASGVPFDVRFTPLIHTSEQSGSIAGPHFNIGYQQFTNRNFMNRLNQGQKVISALYEGRFTSFFGEHNPGLGEGFIPETHNGKIIILPNMNFISSQGAAENQSNMDFLMNAIDYLSNNQALIALRSREVINKPLQIDRRVDTAGLDHNETEKKLDRARDFVKYTNYILPGLLLIIFGLVKYKLEIIRRKRIKEIYE